MNIEKVIQEGREEFEEKYPKRFNGSHYRFIPQGTEDIADFLTSYTQRLLNAVVEELEGMKINEDLPGDDALYFRHDVTRAENEMLEKARSHIERISNNQK